MRIGALCQEQGRDSGLPAIDCTPQGRFAKTVPRFDVSAALKQGLGNLDVTAPRRHVQRRTTLDPITGVYLCATLNQRSHYRAAATTFVCDGIERSMTAPVWDVGIDPQLKERCNDRQITSSGRRVQQGTAAVTFVCEVGILKQSSLCQFRHDGMAAPD